MSRSTSIPPPRPPSSLSQQWREGGPEDRRRLIVDTALDLLQRQDLAAVTMRDVAALLGVGTMTLYTYVEGQAGLHREMIRRGFEMLSCCAEEHPLPTCDEDWLVGGRRYLQFALDHPNLYKLMFDRPVEPADHDVLVGGFQPYLDRVTEYLASRPGPRPDDLPREARRRAGRWWIALHGLAMLALADRLCVLEGDLDTILHDLLSRVGPM